MGFKSMKNVTTSIPYKVCNQFQVSILDDQVVYINCHDNYYIQVPKDAHNWILSNTKDIEHQDQYYPILIQLLDMHVIELDLDRLCVGKASFFVEQKVGHPREHFHLSEIYVDRIFTIQLLHQYGYINGKTHINYLHNSNENIDGDFLKNVSVIVNSFNQLHKYHNIICKNLRFEANTIPNKRDIDILVDILAHHSVDIIIKYTTPTDVARSFFNLKIKLGNDNLTISHDYCSMMSKSKIHNNNFVACPNVSNRNIKCIKLSCGAGSTKFFVDSLGDVFPCVHMKTSKPLGNIKDDTPHELLNNANTYHRGIFSKCRSCPALFFCGGGCQAEYAKSGYVFCDKIKKVIVDEFNGRNKKICMDLIEAQKDLSAYEYMCERNAQRILLIGYGIKEPLFLMRPGFYIDSCNFSQTGIFSTSFSRGVLESEALPVLGEMRFGVDWETINWHLQKGQIVQITVDVFYLPYKYNTYFNKSHGSHTVFLLRKTEKGYIVLDWYHPDYFIGELSLEQLTAARMSENPKNQISAFSGSPINGAYRLLNMNGVSNNVCVRDTVYKNMYFLVQSMLDANGTLSHIKKLQTEKPQWLNDPKQVGYSNAIESFFLLELETRFLILYYTAMVEEDQFTSFHPEGIVKAVVEIQKQIQKIKNTLIIAHRRVKAIDEREWREMLGAFYNKLYQYCEMLIKSMKKM